MKLSEIKKELGGKILLWVECFRGEKVEAVVHSSNDIEYDNKCMYVFETVVERGNTGSSVIKAICDRYGVDKVFAYQKHTVGTDTIDKSKNTLLGGTTYDCDCSYLVAVKKSEADRVPEDGEEFFIDCN